MKTKKTPQRDSRSFSKRRRKPLMMFRKSLPKRKELKKRMRKMKILQRRRTMRKVRKKKRRMREINFKSSFLILITIRSLKAGSR
jgi:hypothetical protein